MIDRAAFVRGLLRIQAACGQEVGEMAMSVYFDSLGPRIDAEEWERFARWVVDVDRFPTWFPKLAELRDALREFRGAPNIDGEAVMAYERVLEAGTYTPEGGTTWIYRNVAETCGKAAADAFIEAGGHNAFANTYRENDRRTRFLEAYVAHVREVPDDHLLPPGSGQKALTAGNQITVFDDRAARQVIERLEVLQGQAAEIVPQRKPLTVDLGDPVTASRAQALRDQAQRLVTEEEAGESA